LRPWMTSHEWMAAQLAARDLFTDDLAGSSRFFARHGLEASLIDAYAKGFIFYSQCVDMPDDSRSLVDGDTFDIGGKSWRVIVGAGHSPAMATLYCAELGVYVAGDQILPKITPNISVVHWDPLGDPLRVFEDSLARIRRLAPDDVLVLPSHRAPFRGLHARIGELERHHASRLDFLRGFVNDRRAVTASECMKSLFGFELDGQQIFFAMGEALAHLNRLCALGEAELVETSADAWFYRATGRSN